MGVSKKGSQYSLPQCIMCCVLIPIVFSECVMVPINDNNYHFPQLDDTPKPLNLL